MIYKKKKGFTLAEVLITLAIIGVVAAMSIPALMKNIEEADTKVRLKKTFATLSQASKRLASDSGGTLKGLGDNSIDFVNAISKYLNFTKKCAPNELYGNCWMPLGKFYYATGSSISDWGNEAGFILSDGQFIFVGHDSNNCDSEVLGVYVCREYFVDVNGFKAPNKLGYDIFRFHLFENGQVMPNGYYGDTLNPANCPKNTATWECTAKYLME